MMMIRFLMLRLVRFAETLTAPEGHHHHARHVNRGQKRGERTDGPEKLAEASRWQTKSRRAPGLPENLIFREKAGEDRNAANRQPARRHRRKRDRHVFPETAHAAHVLLVM